MTKDGRSAIATTTGNQICHITLCGGTRSNYGAASVEAACGLARQSGLTPVVIIDASHANSVKDPEHQPLVMEGVGRQIAGDRRIIGIMIESYLVGGLQDLVAGRPLTYGQSITDSCIDWDTSVTVLERLVTAVAQRRGVVAD